ncbi:hypothetical protein IAQ61_010022 [Plenodomus lingam]|uniref:Uncharacterized protein n=1 Tax=Leptosphaeria maculans (strain JN3 / isolate v23.1.3 / race Av1-4-5-6-7-8) TaxID=985895 RepID=E5AEV6_LEPMJ|nr:hypothetical protein LEMA_P005320.1 [Plenodomus lingam JN3]KAH9862604.1 hypothetical protein IAQ61_010022 [Plenodomus lingam]CBY01745.1 hypothetical protein LEMA_P005320.1 [Plenodomus lingam JN3]
MTKTAKTISLYAPSTKLNVPDLVVSPYQTFEQVLQGVRLAVNSKHAALYTIDAKPIVSVETLKDDQRVLVAVAKSEIMLPDAPVGFIVYCGEERDDVGVEVEGGWGEWDDLTDREKCEHITSLNAMKPTTRNKLRITRSYQSVAADLAVIEEAIHSGNPDAAALSDAEANIENRWNVTYDHFIPPAHCPPRLKTNGTVWCPPVLAGLDVLSSFTQGQARLAAEFLEEAVKRRVDEGEDTDVVVKYEDVRDAVALVYERADVIPMKLRKKAGKKGGGKERRKAARGKGKKIGG